MTQILPIPQIREELIIAAKAGKLVPFIGAGASMLAGCPSWSGFADAAIKFFVKEGKFNLSQFEQLKHLSPRIKLSIAKSLQEQHGIRINYDKILHPNNNTGLQTGQELYGYLSALSKTFVTTNYDRWLAQEYAVPGFALSADVKGEESETPKSRRVLYKVEDLRHDNLQPNTVIHLHGSINDPSTMVVTTEDYISRYSNDRGESENRVLTFLENLFGLRNILFIGYGLEELEILEYVIQKAGRNRKKDSKEIRHFILQGFFTHEQVLADAMEQYYLRECGVQLLPFSKDHNGWEQLLNVIKEFASKIPVATPLLVQEFEEMEALLNG